MAKDVIIPPAAEERLYVLICQNVYGGNQVVQPFWAVNDTAARHFLVDFLEQCDISVLIYAEVWSDENKVIFKTNL